MIEITLDDIKQIEPYLLPEGNVFSDEQKKVLLLNHTFDIVACPGSGKTAVLIAKIALLVKKLESTNKGICIITHTNVGVEEILKQLRKVGIINLPHPHFIGTIHDFLNTFFALRAYNKFFQNYKSINFLDDDDYQNHFSKYFNGFKPDWWTLKAPSCKHLQISFNDDGTTSLIGIEGKRHQDSVHQTFRALLQSGILRHSDTLALSEWYIRKHRIKLHDTFNNRFKFLFIDETQDTSIKQYALIDLIFNPVRTPGVNTIIQRFGDPYQALYNLFNDEEDAWVPIEEHSVQITSSNRFGINIARVLQTTCIRNYQVLQGNPNVSSFQPYILLFNDDNRDQLLTVYASLVKTLENVNSDFKNSIHKVYAICRNHDELIEFNGDYSKKPSENGATSLIKRCQETLLQIITRILRHLEIKSVVGGYYTVGTFVKYMQEEHGQEYQNLCVKLSRWIKVFNTSEETEFDEAVQEIRHTFETLILTIWELNLDVDTGNEMFRLLKTNIKGIVLKQSSNPNNRPNEFIHEDLSIHLNSIHAVKGETHKSTLIIESSRFMDGQFREVYGSDLNSIYSYLMGDYDENKVNDKNIRMYLKLAYVGMSRPTHFSGIAINEKYVSKLDQKMKYASEKGWIVVKLEEFLKS